MSNYFLKSYNSVIAKARYLRKRMTQEEKILWSCLRQNALGFHFRKQVPFGPYILDFFCVTAQIAVELDGSQHGTSDAEEYDKNRDEYLKSFGITVLRFPNRKTHTNLGEVIDVIKTEIQRSNLIRPNAGIEAEARRCQNRSGGKSFGDALSEHRPENR
jgi:very-short-patch-repair endonuclease